MADGDRDKDDATQEGADRPADQPGETGLPGADPSASTRPDGPTPPPDAARPRDLWAGVPRREVSRPDGPRTDERTGAPQAGAALSASFPERAADEPRTITEPPSPALHLDTPDPAGAATPSDGADRPGRGRRTLLLVGVPVVVVALVAAFVLPKVLGDDTPQVPRLGRPTAAADVDASALLLASSSARTKPRTCRCRPPSTSPPRRRAASTSAGVSALRISSTSGTTLVPRAPGRPNRLSSSRGLPWRALRTRRTCPTSSPSSSRRTSPGAR